jgi:hypothetical protein
MPGGKGMKQFLKNNTIIICGTVIILWVITGSVILIVTGNYMSLRSLISLASPAISSLVVLLGVNVRLKEAKEQAAAGIQQARDQLSAVSDKISNGDTTDAPS